MPRRSRKTGLDRARTTGFYLTRRHELQIEALAAHYSRRERTPVTHSQLLQILIERDAKRLKLPEPEITVAIAEQGV